MLRNAALSIALAGMALCGLSGPMAHAESAWPSQPIRLIVPYPAGGPVDGLARVIAPQLGQALGQPIIVENRSGAGGSIGLFYVSKAAGDGSIFGFGVPGAITALPQLQKVPYSATDLNYVSLVARVPQVIAVSPKSDIHTLKELIDRARQHPGLLNYGSSGVGTTPHLGAELLKQLANINIVHVPYTGATPSVTALLGDQVQVLTADLPGLLPFVSHGITIVAVCTDKRIPNLPDVPTTAELGYPAMRVESDYGIIAPEKTPREITEKFHTVLVKVLAMPEVKAKIAAQGAIAESTTADGYRQMMIAETVKWGKVIKEAHITIN
jgi:tripartite-type tricarboxylate transporter receptor subunit TctC